MYVQEDRGRRASAKPPPVRGETGEDPMCAQTAELKKEIARRRRENPGDTRASFAEISFESALDEGFDESIAASKWLDTLRGETK
jgi:hypothetical protein